MSSSTQETRPSGLVGQATAELGEAASSIHEKAGELKEQGRGRLSLALDERTTLAGGQVRQVADAMRHTAAQMRGNGESTIQQTAGLVEAAADRFDDLGAYLRRTSGDVALRDAEDFARRRPWAVAGLGLVAGLAASRFLKASSERRYGLRGSSDPRTFDGGNGNARRPERSRQPTAAEVG